MIWNAPFSQKVTLWILAASLFVGSGISMIQKIWPEHTEIPAVATASDEHSVLIKQLADSIMAERAAHRDDPININTATQTELEKLKGIGPALASAIVAYREQHGAFQSVEELDKVSGIGPKKLEALKGKCFVE